MELILHSISMKNYQYLPEHQKYWNDRRFVYLAVKRDPFILRFASEQHKNDKEIVIRAVKKRGLSLEHASLALKDDFDIVYKAVSQNGNALLFPSNRLKDCYNVVVRAIQQNSWSFQHASNNLRRNKDLVRKARYNGHGNESILTFALELFADDPKFIFEMIRKSDSYVKYIPETLLKDKIFCLELINVCPSSIIYLSDEFKNDRDIVKQTIKKGFCPLYLTSDEIRDDYEIVLSATKLRFFSMRYVSERLKYNEKIILSSLENLDYCDSLEFLPAIFRDNKEIVMKSIIKGGYNFQFASDRLKDDKDVVNSIPENYFSCIIYASRRIKCNKKLIGRYINRYIIFFGGNIHYMRPIAKDRRFNLSHIFIFSKEFKEFSFQEKSFREILFRF